MPFGDQFTLDLVQQDTGATHGASASCWAGAITASADYDRSMAPDVAPGATPQVVTIAGATTEGAWFLESGALGFSRWDSGPWIVQLNVTTGNALIGLKRIYICRVNAAGVSQGTVGSNIAINQALTTGVYEYSISGANQTSATTDRVYIVFVMENADAGPQDVSITPSLRVLTPVVRDLVVRPPPPNVGPSRQGLAGPTGTVFVQGLMPTIVTAHTVEMPLGTLEVAAGDMSGMLVDNPLGDVGRPLGP